MGVVTQEELLYSSLWTQKPVPKLLLIELLFKISAMIHKIVEKRNKDNEICNVYHFECSYVGSW